MSWKIQNNAVAAAAAARIDKPLQHLTMQEKKLLQDAWKDLNSVKGNGWDAGTKTWKDSGAPLSKLQEHVGFFDKDHDGDIRLRETAKGLQDLGLSEKEAWKGALLIHTGLAAQTSGLSVLNPLNPMHITMANIKSAKHASDTGVYDAKGNVVPGKFEAMFKIADQDGDGKLTAQELVTMRGGNQARDAKQSPFKAWLGSLAAKGEFDTLLKVAGEPNSKGEMSLSKERVRKLYEGVLFDELAAARRSAQ